MVIGLGAGSKYFHTLIDGHQDIYGIPGYVIMYFYPHARKILEKYKAKEEVITKILEALPGLYDTRILPGSETLNKLGENQDRFKATNFHAFQSYPECITNRELNTKEILIAIHKAHFEVFGENYKTKNMPDKIFIQFIAITILNINYRF